MGACRKQGERQVGGGLQHPSILRPLKWSSALGKGEPQGTIVMETTVFIHHYVFHNTGCVWAPPHCFPEWHLHVMHIYKAFPCHPQNPPATGSLVSKGSIPLACIFSSQQPFQQGRWERGGLNPISASHRWDHAVHTASCPCLEHSLPTLFGEMTSLRPVLEWQGQCWWGSLAPSTCLPSSFTLCLLVPGIPTSITSHMARLVCKRQRKARWSSPPTAPEQVPLPLSACS